MFLLNNIHNRSYRDIYPTISNVVFDISDSQLKSSKNRDWHKIGAGNIVCVVTSSRKISTFYLIEDSFESDIFDPTEGKQHVITGKVVAKLVPASDMTLLFDQYGVVHCWLPNNKFSIGFNVADLGGSLDALSLTRKMDNVTLGQLKIGA
ncbi:MAG: hypothetical protein C0508_20095 [Cyanobacteria bacterium PR.023]|nr:hypothetical protein [Cyanobacteria bacterium PR.023]